VGTVKFEARIKELVANLPDVAVLVEPLLVVRRVLREQLGMLHRRLLAIRISTRSQLGPKGWGVDDPDSSTAERFRGVAVYRSPTSPRPVALACGWRVAVRRLFSHQAAPLIE
jgi:hypothetical protein